MAHLFPNPLLDNHLMSIDNLINISRGYRNSTLVFQRSIAESREHYWLELWLKFQINLSSPACIALRTNRKDRKVMVPLPVASREEGCWMRDTLFTSSIEKNFQTDSLSRIPVAGRSKATQATRARCLWCDWMAITAARYTSTIWPVRGRLHIRPPGRHWRWGFMTGRGKIGAYVVGH